MQSRIFDRFLLGCILGIAIAMSIFLLTHPHFSYRIDPIQRGISTDIFFHQELSNNTFLVQGMIEYVDANRVVIGINHDLLLLHVNKDIPIVSGTQLISITSLRKNQKIICVLRKKSDGYEILALETQQTDIHSLYNTINSI